MDLETAQLFQLSQLKEVLATKDKEQIQKFLDEWELEIKDNKVVPKESSLKYYEDAEANYDKKQLVKKIQLNSTYGALLNSGSRFFDQRLGQSITLTGRTITRHMCAKTNEMIAGEYSHYGDANIYSDTDSVTGDTLINTQHGSVPIEVLFNRAVIKDENKGKEYAYDDNLMVMSYDTELDEPYLGHTEYIYRHKVSKDLYEITDSRGNKVVVTDDHSVMIMRDGVLLAIKASQIQEDDNLISIC